MRLVQGVIDDVNEQFAKPEQIKKFRMITKELDHEDGELTATQKVKRSAIAGRCSATCSRGMYRRRRRSGRLMEEFVPRPCAGFTGLAVRVARAGFVIIYKSAPA